MPGESNYETSKAAFDSEMLQLKIVTRGLAAANAHAAESMAELEETRMILQAEIAERKGIECALALAKEAAEASNKAKSVFLANMSHELRTPLNAVIGYCEMLTEDATDAFPEAMLDLRRIHQSATTLLQLINNVLDASKIEAGRMRLYLERIHIGQLCGDVVQTIASLVRKNNNTLAVDCGESETYMYADPLKLGQCILNLLSNAAKFTQNGTITLRVTKTMNGSQAWMEWAVSDTGIGIPSDQIDKLFCSFFQVDSQATRSHTGTGLGLAISKGLCEMMGGTIRVESVPGTGSTFTILLPIGETGPTGHHEDGFKKQLLCLGVMTRNQPEAGGGEVNTDRPVNEGGER